MEPDGFNQSNYSLISSTAPRRSQRASAPVCLKSILTGALGGKLATEHNPTQVIVTAPGHNTDAAAAASTEEQQVYYGA